MVWIGGPQEDGSRELFCQFRIERVDAKERLRRIEHQVFSVLKTVFLGVEDYPAMRRTLSELGTRLRGRVGDAAKGDADAARAFLDWLRADNYVMLGLLRYQFGAAVGGPLLENRLFFFASYDQQRRNFPAISTTNDPAFFDTVDRGTTGAGLKAPSRALSDARIDSTLAFLTSLTGEGVVLHWEACGGELFYSYRRDGGPTGSLMACVGWSDGGRPTEPAP